MPNKYLSEGAIDALFTYRRWTEEEVSIFSPLREKAKELAHEINNAVPDSPQKTCAINALHEAVYLINTAVSLNPLKES